MTKARTFALFPLWAIALAALLMFFALRAQIAPTVLFTSQGHHISAPQLGPAPMNTPVVGNQPANAQGSNSVITKTGTTNPSAPGAQQSSTPNPATGSNAGPCTRAGNPAPMCPVTEP